MQGMEKEEIKTDEENKENKNSGNGKEIIRFVITGLACALLDFGVSALVIALLNKMGLQGVWATAISTTVGFLFGVILNYILSTYWVFKNVKDKKKTKTVKFIIAFVLLSAVAWGLSVGTQELCALVCKSAWGIIIDGGMDVLLQKILTFTFWTDVTFWAFFVAFCLRTLVGLVWNYFTRKYILYK